MFCSQCSAPWAITTSSAARVVLLMPVPLGLLPRDSLSPSSLFRNRPWRMRQRAVWLRRSRYDQDSGCASACMPNRVLPALICVVSLLVLFISVIGGIAAAIGFGSLHCERVRFRLWYRVGP